MYDSLPETHISVKAHVSMDVKIRSMRRNDWPVVRSIYLAGIATGQATFETRAPAWGKWNSTHLARPRLVAVYDRNLVGWAALSPVSKRNVYAGVAEVSVYVSAESRGRGLGRMLLQRLISESEKLGIWTLQASIFPENHASVSLHQACGFRKVGVRRRIGKMDGIWRDTVLFERRSEVAGID
jgi:phosphinothricin acetyltransferase